MKYYPAFIDLRDRPILIIGDNYEVEFKVEQMLEAGAQIKLVYPTLPSTLKNLVETGKIIYRQGKFEENDLNDVWLVICSTEDDELNKSVAQAAEARRIFCNILDVTPLCTFIAPAIVDRNDVVIAVSTSGTSPALAQRIKREIGDSIGPEYGHFGKLLGKIRPLVLNKIPDRQQRAELFQLLVNDSNILNLLRAEQQLEAEQVAFQLIEEAVEEYQSIE